MRYKMRRFLSRFASLKIEKPLFDGFYTLDDLAKDDFLGERDLESVIWLVNLL